MPHPPLSSVKLDYLSPNHDARPTGVTPSVLVLHYTGMPGSKLALERLCDPAANVSAHYLVDEDGSLYGLVAEDQRAWHAGISQWRGRYGVNDVSIGVEIVNPGHEFGYRPFTSEQIRAVTGLCADIVARHGIAPRDVVAHSDIAPARKEDPGEFFPWERLAEYGIGLWPGKPLPAPVDRATLESRLTRFGYCVGSLDRYEASLEQVIVAFQRRYRPERFDGDWDGECEARLNQLLALADESA